MNVKLNKNVLSDKIHACWIGKNIGGTIGAPYEGTEDILDITGFASKKGEPLPNDDLDLQLVWLYAVEKYGPHQLNSTILAEHWMTMISPYWNEYGVCKANMQHGFLPPISGEIDNDKWKTSNGAWIRSEIWACLCPGFPGIARKYAYYDATVDHSISEGTIAEIFTATLEAEAFVNTDIRTIIDTALKSIPENSRVYRAVSLVIDCYEKNIDYRKVRELVVKQSKDLGFFQAPANVAFVVLGLLYGEGNFKKSIIYTVNCGDDTDCTGATVGSVLGILYGVDGIPSDWREYIGDDIKSISINGQYYAFMPKTCTELTDRVVKMIPVVLHANGIDATYTDDDMFIPDEAKDYGEDILKKLTLPAYSMDISNNLFTNGTVTFDKKPVLAKGESLTLTFDMQMHLDYTSWCQITTALPEGIKADYDQSVHIHAKYPTKFTVTLTAKKRLSASNMVYIILNFDGHVVPIVVPVAIIGK